MIQHEGGQRTSGGDLCSCDDDYTPLVEHSACTDKVRYKHRGLHGGEAGDSQLKRLWVRILMSAVYFFISAVCVISVKSLLASQQTCCL